MNEFNKEIEIKFKVDENILSEFNNIKFDSYEESDEYFFTEKTLSNDVYLRFRKKKGKIFLELKSITSQATNDVYEADEILLELSEEQYEELKRIFNAIFPIKLAINKKRSKGFFNDCEICLDNVDELGNFLEIEGPREKILEICKQLNLNLDHRDKDKGYVKILMKKRGLWKDLL